MPLTEKHVLQRVSGVTAVRLKVWSERGWISPARSETGYVYTEIDVARCDLIRQFRDEMEIDSETVPVVLKLLDQVYSLRRELRMVTSAIKGLPEDAQRQVYEAIRNSHGDQREDE